VQNHTQKVYNCALRVALLNIMLCNLNYSFARFKSGLFYKLVYMTILVPMLSSTTKRKDTFKLLRLLPAYRLIKELSFRGERISEKGILFMIAVMIECSRTNEFAKLLNILGVLGISRGNANPDRLISPLLRLGLVERPGFGLFVLTVEGEFFLRDIETMFSRVTQNTVRSKLRKIAPTDPEAK